MKIIYATDIHGDFEKVTTLLCDTRADVYLIAGDLIDIPFYSMETSIRYHILQTYFHGIRHRMGAVHVLIEDFVDELLENPDTPEELQAWGTLFQQMTIRARRVMQQKYKVLKNIITMKQKAQVFCLPGNYDMDLRYTSLHDHDLHLKSCELDGMSFGGYGGAEVWTAGIPERYIVKYRAGMGSNETDNEMYRFFSASRPQIIAAHQPAFGIHDKALYGGPCGSPTLRTYCDSHEVLLCLTGHAHDAWGVQARGGTLYLNPSNFGAVTLTNGEVFEGGFFHLIEIEDRQVHKIILKKISDRKIHDVADYFPSNGTWAEKVIDPGRYEALLQRRNFDMQALRSSHIPEIALFNDIKKFYRTFQTPETEDRLDSLEEVIPLLEARFQGDIAMDVMGSVNMGISQSSSDIDFIVYSRCTEPCHDGFVHCQRFEQAQALLEDLQGPRYDFHILDCINLNQVEESIHEKNFECEVTQRFLAYRAMGRPVNYRVIAPVEDLLDQDPLFREEVEGSVQSYLRIFCACSQNALSFKKYESRLTEIGIRLPDSVKRKIKQFLKED